MVLILSVVQVVGVILVVVEGCCGICVVLIGLNLLLLCKFVLMIVLIFFGGVSGFIYLNGIILIG